MTTFTDRTVTTKRLLTKRPRVDRPEGVCSPWWVSAEVLVPGIPVPMAVARPFSTWAEALDFANTISVRGYA